MSHSDVRINGGFFVCRRELLDWIEPGDELVEETFAQLIPRGEVDRVPVRGFFGPMDTIKDRQRLEALHESGPRTVAAGRAARRPRAEAGLMLALALVGGGAPLRRVLAIGCHADDIEIGCGGDAARAHARAPGRRGDVGRARRRGRARAPRRERAPRTSSRRAAARRGRRPRVPGRRTCRTTARRSRRRSRSSKRRRARLVLTHTRDDLHQDHRLACELTWNTFRDHLILEYEIPKCDGDLGTPNLYVPSRRGRRRARSSSSSCRHFPTPGGQALVRRRDLPRADAAPGHGVRARRAGTPRRSTPGSSRSVGADRMRVLVTGHHGYIGSVLAPLVAGAGHDVVGLDTCFYRGCDFGRRSARWRPRSS